MDEEMTNNEQATDKMEMTPKSKRPSKRQSSETFKKGRRKKKLMKGRHEDGRESEVEDESAGSNECGKREENRMFNMTAMFNDDDNLIVMSVEDSTEFPSEDESGEIIESTDEGDEEVILQTQTKNNNAIVDSEHKKVNHRSQAEIEEEREDQIVNKTVTKLQEIMTSGGYLNQAISKNTAANSTEKNCGHWTEQC